MDQLIRSSLGHEIWAPKGSDIRENSGSLDMNVIIMLQDELDVVSFFMLKGSRKDNDCVKVSYIILFDQTTHIIKRYHVLLFNGSEK